MLRALALPSCFLFLCLIAGGEAFIASGASGSLIARSSPVQRCYLRGTSQRAQIATTVMLDSSSRREAIGGAAKFAFLLSAALPLSVSAEESTAVDAADKAYQNSKSGFQLAYPAGWKETKKPVQTHQDEILFKSTTTKGAEVGITVDPVKIDSLLQFGTPKEVGKRVMGVERAKDGVLSAKLLAVGQTEYDGVPYYTIEYQSDSTRGNKHFIACVAINKKKLYVLTAQAKVDSFAQEEENLRRVVASFRLTSPSS